MPGGPDRPRAASRARAEHAYQLKCMGHTYRQIAEQLGFKSHASVINAVKRYLATQPPEDVAVMRAYTAGSYRIVTARLHRLLAKAETDGDRPAAATLARAIADIEDKHAKLTGQYVPEAKPDVEVTVNVTGLTPAAVVGEAETNLLAIAKARRANMPAIAPPTPAVIDAEVVEA